MNQDEARARARLDTARAVYEHEKKQGKDPSFESVRRYVNERADVQDKRKDWKIKE